LTFKFQMIKQKTLLLLVKLFLISKKLKNNNLNTRLLQRLRVLLFFLKLKSRLIFNQKDIYCNTHGSFVR
jgi:hypothetical protein